LVASRTSCPAAAEPVGAASDGSAIRDHSSARQAMASFAAGC
jgi:hypothetical protein